MHPDEREKAPDTTLSRYLSSGLRRALGIDSGQRYRNPALVIALEDFKLRLREVVSDLRDKRLSSRCSSEDRKDYAQEVEKKFGSSERKPVPRWMLNVDSGDVMLESEQPKPVRPRRPSVPVPDRISDNALSMVAKELQKAFGSKDLSFATACLFRTFLERTVRCFHHRLQEQDHVSFLDERAPFKKVAQSVINHIRDEQKDGRGPGPQYLSTVVSNPHDWAAWDLLCTYVHGEFKPLDKQLRDMWGNLQKELQFMIDGLSESSK